MEAVLSKIGQLVLDIGRHKLYKVKWNVIDPLIKKWSRNRDPDMSRVEEMSQYIKIGYLPPILHIAELSEEGLVCYDGNHRRECFKLVPNKMEEILVDVIFSATQKEVYEAFEHLNKSVQVPAIYIEENTDQIHKVREEILEIVKQLEKKYKSYTSTSVRCRAPHFNRDKLTDNLYNIWSHFHGTIMMEQIKEALTELNRSYSQEKLCKPHSSYSTTVIKKCQDQNFWLFIDKEIPADHIRIILEQNKK